MNEKASEEKEHKKHNPAVDDHIDFHHAERKVIQTDQQRETFRSELLRKEEQKHDKYALAGQHRLGLKPVGIPVESVK